MEGLGSNRTLSPRAQQWRCLKHPLFLLISLKKAGHPSLPPLHSLGTAQGAKLAQRPWESDSTNTPGKRFI